MFDRSDASLPVFAGFCLLVLLGGLRWDPFAARAASPWPVMASYGKVYYTHSVFYGLVTLTYPVQ